MCLWVRRNSSVSNNQWFSLGNLQIPGYVAGEPHTSHGVRFELADRLRRTPAEYECDVDDRFFLRFRKNPNRLQKKVRNGSPSVPLLSLKARFWRLYFSFFQTPENPCLKRPSVLSNVHSPTYQSQKPIISRSTDEHLWFSGLGRKERFVQQTRCHLFSFWKITVPVMMGSNI